MSELTIYPTNLINDIREVFWPSAEIVELAESQDPRLIDELQRLGNQYWSQQELIELRDFSIPMIVEHVENARVLLIDAQRAYYDFCKEVYGECPEPDCTRPLILGKDGWRKCPWHAPQYHLNYNGGGHVEKKQPVGTGIMDL